MAQPPADLLAIQSSLDHLLVLVDRRARRAPTYPTDKGPLLRAARHLTAALLAIDQLVAAYRSEH